MSVYGDNIFHPASTEKEFCQNVTDGIDVFFQKTMDRFLRNEEQLYTREGSRRLQKKINEWIDRLWPVYVRPKWPAKRSEADVYLQAAVAASDASYFGLLRESARRHAKKHGIPALLKAIDQADAAGIGVLPSGQFDEGNDWIEFCRSDIGASKRLKLPCYSDPDSRPEMLRDSLVRLLNSALESRSPEGRVVSAWDIFAKLYPTSRKKGKLWIAKELKRFAIGALDRGVVIQKVPAVFAAFLGEESAQAVLQPEVRGFYLTDPEHADKVSVWGWEGTTWIRWLAECVHEFGTDNFSWVLNELASVFPNPEADLSGLAHDPHYVNFLKNAGLSGSGGSCLEADKARAPWWLPVYWSQGKDYPQGFDKKGLSALTALFAPVLPRGFGWGPDVFFRCLVREKLLEKTPVNLLEALGRALTPEQKKRIALEAPQAWRWIFKPDDPVFREGGWRLILAARNREAKEWLCESLSQEKDSSAYLRFAASKLESSERSLAWLERPDLEQRFIGDYYGMSLWKKAGGLALESDPAGALCRAWGSAGYRGRVSDLEGALAQGLADERLLGLMATKTGLARSHGRLLRTLLEAGRFFEPEGVLSTSAALKAMEHLRRQGRDEAVRAKARGRILRLLPSAESLAKAREFLAGDEGWCGAPLRGAEDLPLLFGEFRRDPVALAAVLSEVKFPEADVKAALFAYVKTLQTAKAPYMDQASFGLFAGLWPDPNAGLVKWLVSAINWKKVRGDRLSKAYRTFKIPKKHGGQRQISAPIVPLKRLQHSVLRNLLDPLGSHPAAMGFVAGRSILTNASAHAGRPVVAVTDVHNCFPSVKWPVLYRVLERDLGEKLGLPAVALITDLCTLDGGLPMGSPASPALLNRVLFKADEILAAEAEKRGCAYTRYADDLTFSGDDRAVELVGRARSVLGAAGLVLDPAKTNIFRRGRRQMVTGLVVNEKADVPKFYRRLVRAAVDKYCRGGTPFWEGRSMTLPELLGRVAFVKGVHPGTGEKLLSRIREEQKRREAEALVAHECQERISK